MTLGGRAAEGMSLPVLTKARPTDPGHRLGPQTRPTDLAHRLGPQTQAQATDSAHRPTPQTWPTDPGQRLSPQTQATDSVHRLRPDLGQQQQLGNLAAAAQHRLVRVTFTL